jgi:hypothetical protein
MADVIKKDLVTPIGWVSFPHVFKPRPPQQGFNEGKDPEYECVLIVPERMQKKPAMKKLQAAVVACAKEHFGEKVKLDSLRLPFRKGSTIEVGGVNDTDIVLRAKSKFRPDVIDVQKQPIIDEEEVYPGMWAEMTVRCFAYDVQGNKGVSLSLSGLRKVADGTRMDGRKPTADIVEDIDDETLEELKELGADVADATDDEAEDLLAS